jgi:predicted NBD/HSP70 family sugar kinase
VSRAWVGTGSDGADAARQGRDTDPRPGRGAGPATPGARPDEARRYNRAALLRRLHVHGPRTRATLATELGLNRSTIKAVVDGLTEAGVVTEAVPAQRNGAGRPSLMVIPEAEAAVVLAVDVQVERVAMSMVGIGGQVLGRHSWNLHRRTRTPGEVITHIAETAQLLGEELAVTAQGAGVSVPGVIRRDDGWVHEAPNLGWQDVALGQRLNTVLRMPVQVANDAELGALAEHVRGVAVNATDLVYISADRGVGGGVISEGRPLRGTRGYVGELGHLVVRPGGRNCYCGSRGCWETEVGEAALCRALGLPQDSPRGVVVAELRSLATVPAPGPLDEFTEWLAIGLVSVVNLMAPELVVLGDLFTALPPAVVDRVRRTVHERSMVSRAVGGTRIETSPLGRDAKLVGAAELAFEPVLGAV